MFKYTEFQIDAKYELIHKYDAPKGFAELLILKQKNPNDL